MEILVSDWGNVDASDCFWVAELYVTQKFAFVKWDRLSETIRDLMLSGF